MFLRRLRLENIRSIKELEVDFRAPGIETHESGRPLIRKRTFILGENGTGKSSILRAIALVTAGSEALRELLIDPDSWIRRGESECRLEADLVTAENEERRVSLRWERGQHFKEIIDGNTETLELLDNALRHAERNYFTVGYGTSRRPTSPRFSSQTPELFVGRRAQNVASLFSVDAVMNSLVNWAIDLDYRQGESGLGVINEAMDELLPGVSFSHIDKERRSLMFRSQDGVLPFELLSDGYQSMAGWCGDLLYRITETYKDFSNPLLARGVLLVDEIELHLHPVWQRALITFLNQKLPKMQIIMTTHSLLTAHEAGEQELYFLKRAAADSPAEMARFEGTPNRIFAHQLLLMPAFGLETINSKVVDDLKMDYEKLKSKTQRSSDESARLEELSIELSDLPEWSRGTELEREQLKVMKAIEKNLEKGN